CPGWLHAVHGHVHVPPHGGVHFVHLRCLPDGERPGQACDHQEKGQDNTAVVPRKGAVLVWGHWGLSGWRQLKVFGPRRSKAMCLEERCDQSKVRPKAPVTMLRLAWPTVRNPGTTSGRGAL